MIAVVQRVRQASVTVEADQYSAAIGPGMCVLLAVERGDDDAAADWMARKLANLRIFPDDARHMNRSVQEARGAILLVSQFTLAGDCSRGNRPSFDDAAEPEAARPLYERVGAKLRAEYGLQVECGVFAALMQVSLVNDGPVTLIVRR
jgi:D-tyrosyl-tRNA(Tyr) deacylase